MDIFSVLENNRIIESAISNATVLHNICVKDKKDKVSTYDVVTVLADHYLDKAEKEKLQGHKLLYIDLQRQCESCKKRVKSYCSYFKKHFCNKCFTNLHQLNTCENKTEKRELLKPNPEGFVYILKNNEEADQICDLTGKQHSLIIREHI